MIAGGRPYFSAGSGSVWPISSGADLDISQDAMLRATVTEVGLDPEGFFCGDRVAAFQGSHSRQNRRVRPSRRIRLADDVRR